MKAAVVESPGRLVIRDVPAPAPGEYEALCRIVCGTVCAGTDAHLVQGHAPFCQWVEPPFILGHESVGRVIAVGRRVRCLRPGDLVTRVGAPAVGDVHSGWGGFAAFGVATDWQAMRDDGIDGWRPRAMQRALPDDVSPRVGTLFITWRETLSYLRRLGVRGGQAVLIVGSGGNALAFASHARNAGARDVVILGAAPRVELAASAGATRFVDYRDRGATAALACQFDRVIDSVGSATSVLTAIEAVAPRGTIGVYGLDELDASDAARAADSSGKTFSIFQGGYDEAETHDDVLRDLRAGRLDPEVLLERRAAFRFDQIPDAMAAVADRSRVKPLIQMAAE